MKIWNTKTGKCDSTLSEHSGSVRGVCFSPDGSRLASCSRDHSVKIWNVITRECVLTLRHSRYVNAVSYSCLFSNVGCVLTIEDFTGKSGVFASVQMVGR